MKQRIHLRLVASLAAIVALAGCSLPVAPDDGVTAGAPDVVVTEGSFRCIRDMTKVRGFFVDNLLGDLEATLAVAKATGGTYPPGSLIR